MSCFSVMASVEVRPKPLRPPVYPDICNTISIIIELNLCNVTDPNQVHWNSGGFIGLVAKAATSG